IITLIIFFLAIANAEEIPPLPEGPNEVKAEIDDFIREGLMKTELYTHDRVEAGTQNIVTRKALEEGEIAVLRYGNKKPSGGRYPYSVWNRHLIQKKIDEELENEGIDPSIPDEKLTPSQRDIKNRVIRNVRKETGYSLSEQKNAIEKKKREVGRELTEDELKTVLDRHPLKEDIQADELETLAIIHKTDIYKIHSIFIDQNPYEKLFPIYFRKSHVFTDDELKERNIVLKAGESLFYAHLKLDDALIKYTVLNHWRKSERTEKLNGKPTTIPIITTAWTIDERFFGSDEDENKDPFSHEGVFVIGGYLELEPYIEKDPNGFEKISDSSVLAVYHTYTRMDELHKDLSSVNELFRESVGRILCQTIFKKIKDILGP
ncbi:MAG: hypothetical protein AAB309_03175, partial [Deltaproteobacteria bacterium]